MMQNHRFLLAARQSSSELGSALAPLRRFKIRNSKLRFESENNDEG